LIGLFGAAWIIFFALVSHISMASFTSEMKQDSYFPAHLLAVHTWRSTIPLCLLGCLIALPYSRIHRIFSYIGTAIISGLGIYIISLFYGLYFNPIRFVPTVIPKEVWISVATLAFFLITQILAILLKQKKPKQSEQCDPPNGYPRHASCLGSFLARQESRHGQPSVIADVRQKI
jgi:hypothetical protein